MENQLRNVVNNVYLELLKGEVLERKYWDLTQNYLAKEGLLIGLDANKERKLSVEVGVRIMDKLDLDNPWGLENRYICIKDVDLSENALKDLEAYNSILNQTYEYLMYDLGDDNIHKFDFDQKVNNYLQNTVKLHEKVGREKRIEAKVRIIETLKDKFNIMEVPDVYTSYNQEIVNILKQI